MFILDLRNHWSLIFGTLTSLSLCINHHWYGKKQKQKQKYIFFWSSVSIYGYQHTYLWDNLTTHPFSKTSEIHSLTDLLSIEPKATLPGLYFLTWIRLQIQPENVGHPVIVVPLLYNWALPIWRVDTVARRSTDEQCINDIFPNWLLELWTPAERRHCR